MSYGRREFENIRLNQPACRKQERQEDHRKSYEENPGLFADL